MPKTATGKIASFFKPNFPYSKVAAKEIESAEDSLFKVEITMIKLSEIKLLVE